MKIASWNVNSLRVRLPHVLRWLESERPDLLALQETKLPDEAFPSVDFEALGYHPLFRGQPTYNGVAILSREPGEEVCEALTGFSDDARRVIGATFGDVRLLNLYVPNGQRVDSEKYTYKLKWLTALESQLEDELKRHRKVVLVGDFNIAPEDRDVHDPAAWAGSVLVSDRERQHFRALLGCGLRDTLREFDQSNDQFSWWDYRAGAFRRNRGLRIDLILASEGIDCEAASIDRQPRGWERPSDHTPVVAIFR